MAKKKPKQIRPVSTKETRTPVYVTQYEITDEPIQEPAYRRLPKAIKEKLENLYQVAQRQPQQAIPELIELQKKYPRVPQIYNYLAVAYSHAREKDKAEEITPENIRMNSYCACTHRRILLNLSKPKQVALPESGLFFQNTDMMDVFETIFEQIQQDGKVDTSYATEVVYGQLSKP